MSLKESCIIFNIDDINNIDKKSLKKKYYKLSLLYHPDKNKNSNRYFIKINESYNFLNNYIDKNNHVTEIENNYEKILELLTFKNINCFINLIYFYKEKQKYKQSVININTSIDKVFNKSVFKFNENIFIPLWHKYICEFNITQQKYFIYKIVITDLPKYIYIKKNNDIIINLHKNAIKKLSVNNVYITTNTCISFFADDIFFKNQILCLKNRGIPKTNSNNIFDSSKLSDIYITINN